MTGTVLISADDLRRLVESGQGPLLLDCGAELADPDAGPRAFAAGHLPGAVHAHLERDLSGPKDGRNGRHPLPARDTFAATVARWGITGDVDVVAYDDHGSPYAARAWWLLRWLGHARVRVLDGGRGAWLAAGGALTTASAERPSARPGATAAAQMPTVDAGQLRRAAGSVTLIDARAAERFRGEVEPLDPVAGHIPGAIHRFFKSNLGADGRFKSPSDLRAEFTALGAAQGEVVHYCGSGVTASHNLLAMAHAGLEPGALYPGSWSEWCSDPDRPVARG